VFDQLYHFAPELARKIRNGFLNKSLAFQVFAFYVIKLGKLQIKDGPESGTEN
jgi:hypothetical protein